jgi:hypothetical protein
MQPHHMTRKFYAGKNGKVVLGNDLAHSLLRHTITIP